MSLNAKVLVVVIVDVVCRAPDERSLLSAATHHLPLTQTASKGVSKQFSRTCAIIQIKYVLPKLCHLPQYSHDPGIPPPGYLTSPHTRVYGPGIHTHTGAGDTVWQLILNLYKINISK